MSRPEHRTSCSVRRLAPLAAALLLAPGMLAQNADPRQEIKDIAEQVEMQLQEIDHLLLESSDAQQVRSKSKDLLKQSIQRSTEVEQGIDHLIEMLIDLKSQCGGGN
tara:strand:+ start:906 stop:1226 length:321 start_codon:yes stop_codon:yes gene_type:complete